MDNQMYVISGSRIHPCFWEDHPRDWLVLDAKSYGIKGISKMNRKQLATAILEHLATLEGNYKSPMDEIEKQCVW